MPVMTNSHVALDRTWNTTPAWTHELLHVGALEVSALIKLRLGRGDSERRRCQ